MIIDSNDLIYNRFDIIYPNCYEEYIEECNGIVYKIQMHVEDGVAILNIWGKNIPENIVNNAIDEWGKKYTLLEYFKIQRSTINIRQMLVKGGEYILPVPETNSELLGMLNTKERQTLRRKKRQIQKLGTVYTRHYDIIPNDYVELYFRWKRVTHQREYHLSAEEYVKRYHVSDALLLFLDNGAVKPIAILFYCKVNKTIYFENFSYDVRYSKYSPGYLLYIFFLELMVLEKNSFVFLGGGNYDYKAKFNTIYRNCYSGEIFTEFGKKRIKEKFSKKRIALYGMGGIGKSVAKLIQETDAEIAFCIDRNAKHDINGVLCYKPEDMWPQCDLVLITIATTVDEVEAILRKKNIPFLYWREFIDYKRSGE